MPATVAGASGTRPLGNDGTHNPGTRARNLVCTDGILDHRLADSSARAGNAMPHAHQLLGSIATFTSEPQYVVRGDSGIPFVPLLQQRQQTILVVLPIGDETGILPHLIECQLKSFGKARGIA